MARIGEIRAEDRAETLDGSGEFGAFDDHLESVRTALGALGVGGVGFFNEEGVIEGKGHLVRYYSHRDSRGVDSTMANTAWGLIALSSRTRLSAGVQAAYRLRGLDSGQRLHLFVVTEDAAPNGASGKNVLDMLMASEQAYTDAATLHLEGQLAHASRRKYTRASFEREVTCYARKSRQSRQESARLSRSAGARAEAEDAGEGAREYAARGCV